MKPFFIFLLTIVTSSGWGQSANDILAEYFERSGGLEKLKKIRNIKYYEYSWLDMGRKDPAKFQPSLPEGDSIIKIIKKPFYSHETVFRNGTVQGIVVTNSNELGYIIYSSPTEQPQWHSVPQQEQYRKQTMLEVFDLLDIFEDGTATFSERKTIAGKGYDELVCTDRSTKRKKSYYFNVSTHLLDFWEMNPDTGIRIVLGDYRNAGGITLPFSKTGFNHDVIYTQETIKRVEFNVELKPNLFEIPGN